MLSHFLETFMQTGIRTATLKRMPDTAYIDGNLVLSLVKKEIYSVIFNKTTNKPYMVIGAFIISPETSDTEADIRYGISRCSHKDHFSLRKGMKIAKANAISNFKPFSVKDNYIPDYYYKKMDKFRAIIDSRYRITKADFTRFDPVYMAHTKECHCYSKKVILRNGDPFCYKCNKWIPVSRY